MSVKPALLQAFVVAGAVAVAIGIAVVQSGPQLDSELNAAASGERPYSFDAGQAAPAAVGIEASREPAAQTTDPRTGSSAPAATSPEQSIFGDLESLEDVPSMATILYEDAELRAEFEALLYNQDPEVRSEAQQLLDTWSGDEPAGVSADIQD